MRATAAMPPPSTPAASSRSSPNGASTSTLSKCRPIEPSWRTTWTQPFARWRPRRQPWHWLPIVATRTWRTVPDTSTSSPRTSSGRSRTSACPTAAGSRSHRARRRRTEYRGCMCPVHVMESGPVGGCRHPAIWREKHEEALYRFRAERVLCDRVGCAGTRRALKPRRAYGERAEQGEKGDRACQHCAEHGEHRAVDRKDRADVGGHRTDGGHRRKDGG